MTETTPEAGVLQDIYFLATFYPKVLSCYRNPRLFVCILLNSEDIPEIAKNTILAFGNTILSQYKHKHAVREYGEFYSKLDSVSKTFGYGNFSST